MLRQLKTKSRGYTIVEVMLFLAVSSFMFFIAANFINGKQAKNEFKQGMNDVNAQVQNAINDVSNGFYPGQNNFSCSAPNIGPPNPQTTPANQQGENKGCVFLGKIIQFAPTDGKSSGSQPGNDYNVLTIAARQYANKNLNFTNDLPMTFQEAVPIVVTSPDLTNRSNFQFGLTISKVFTGAPDNSNNSNVGAVGFFGSFGKYSSAGALSSGSQTMMEVPIPGSNLNQDTTKINNIITGDPGQIDTAASNGSNTVVVCFTGGANQHGSLTIGGANGQRVTTFIKIGPTDQAVGCAP